MSVHYKFKSALKYDTITFDGLHISVKDLKRDILHQKQIGKTGDFDLQITNAQTNEGRPLNGVGICLNVLAYMTASRLLHFSIVKQRGTTIQSVICA